MAYEILNKETVVSTTIFVTVKYDFLPESIIVPITDGDIEKGLSNREITEREKLENENI